ncbi:MAG: ABC transporter substrate-binding protein [Flavobacteriales bacterium]|nr:MAG: ABC transporter substrate-binding protein [Flavobacteriales bacterium]
MKISKEIKVGFVAIFAIALLIWGYNYLKGTNLFIKSVNVYAIYPKVPGLSVSSPVIINGVQSGVVDDIYFHPDKSSRVIVKLNITENGLSVPKNSVAELISIDFMGSKAIGLKLGSGVEELQNGDTLQSDFELSMLEDFSEQILPIKEKVEHLMLTMDTAVVKLTETLDNLNGMFTNQNKRNLSLTLSNLKTTLEGFDELSKTLNHTVKTKINPTMTSFGELADSLKALDINATLTKAQSAMDNMSAVMEKMNKGEGTMGKLINNDSLYNNLTAASKEMEELLEDMKLHPKRYFRILSRKEIPYKKD